MIYLDVLTHKEVIKVNCPFYIDVHKKEHYLGEIDL